MFMAGLTDFVTGYSADPAINLNKHRVYKIDIL